MTKIESQREKRTRSVTQSVPEEGFVTYTNVAHNKVIPPYSVREVDEHVHGPVFLQDPTRRKIGSVTVLKAVESETAPWGEEIMYLADADLQWYAASQSRAGARLVLRHSFAKDVELSPARIAELDLASFAVTAVDGGRLTFTAWITKANFYGAEDLGSDAGVSTYSDGDRDLLALKAEDRAEEDPEKGGDWYANNGYPYLPPRKTDIVGWVLPMQIEGTVYHAGDYNVKKLFRKAAGLKVKP